MTPDEQLRAAVAALRRTSAPSSEQVGATQHRVLATLAERWAGARQAQWLPAAAAVVFAFAAGSTAWAAVTGRIDLGRMFGREPAVRAPGSSPRARPVAGVTSEGARPARPEVATVIVPEASPQVVGASGSVVVRTAASRRARAWVARPRRGTAAAIVPTDAAGSDETRGGPTAEAADEIYRRGHVAQFASREMGAALAAWDEYLRVAPDGRFAPEAQFNRAVALVRLGRRAEALAELREIELRGSYRADDVARLVRMLTGGNGARGVGSTHDP